MVDLEKVRLASTNAGATACVAFTAGEEIATIKAAAAADIKHVDEAGVPFVVNPANGTVSSMEAYGFRPVMIRQDVTLHDTASFAAYTNRFKDADTVVFADQLALTFSAVLDYHRATSEDPDHHVDGARWGKHRVALKLLETDEWKEWISMHGKEMNQSAFGAWFEDRIPDIKQPDAAVIIEMARNFEAKKDVAYNGKIDPDTGSVALRYEELAAGVTREGSVRIVRGFTLSLVPFLGAEKVDVEARIRWRVSDENLLLRYELIRHRYVLEQAFLDEREDLETTLEKDVTVFAGAVAAPPK